MDLGAEAAVCVMRARHGAVRARAHRCASRRTHSIRFDRSVPFASIFVVCVSSCVYTKYDCSERFRWDKKFERTLIDDYIDLGISVLWLHVVISLSPSQITTANLRLQSD